MVRGVDSGCVDVDLSVRERDVLRMGFFGVYVGICGVIYFSVTCLG